MNGGKEGKKGGKEARRGVEWEERKEGGRREV